MFAILKREFRAYFNSPLAYILIGLFTVMNSIFFTNNLNYGSGDFMGNLSTMTFLLLFIVPILSMRIMTEDRKNGTEILLITSPVRISGIVAGKFLAVLFVFLIMTAITFIYPIILIILGAPLTIQLVAGYVGYILLGAAFISVGVFVSSLTESQVISAVVTFISLMIMWLAQFLSSLLGGVFSKILSWFSLMSRYDDFSNGILSLSPIVYYLSFMMVFLFLTVRIIEKRRWSQG